MTEKQYSSEIEALYSKEAIKIHKAMNHTGEIALPQMALRNKDTRIIMPFVVVFRALANLHPHRLFMAPRVP